MCDSAWSDPVRLMRREIQELTTLRRRFFSPLGCFLLEVWCPGAMLTYNVRAIRQTVLHIDKTNKNKKQKKQQQKRRRKEKKKGKKERKKERKKCGLPNVRLCIACWFLLGIYNPDLGIKMCKRRIKVSRAF